MRGRAAVPRTRFRTRCRRAVRRFARIFCMLTAYFSPPTKDLPAFWTTTSPT